MIDWSRLADRLERLTRATRPGSLLTLSAALPALPAGLPAGQPGEDDWFHWRRPEADLSLTGIGCALRVDTEGPGRLAALGATLHGLRDSWCHEQEDDAMPPPVAFCGFAFAPEGGSPLPNACLVVPALLFRRAGSRISVSFSCTRAEAPAAIGHWRRLAESLVDTRTAKPGPIGRRPSPLADLAFLARAGAALAAIESGHFAKLVLTRSIRLVADAPLEPAPVLDALAEGNPGCTIWAAGRGNKVFLGASPERLLNCRGGQAEVDALAGTAWTALAAGEGNSDSLGSDKNRREHDLVVASIREALAPLCETLAIPEAPEVMRLGSLQHLRRRIVGRLREGVSAFDLITRLHPTPAVGGTPTPAALEWLAAHGDRRAAWYTGGVGWLDAEGNADVAVALRCGLLSGAEATLFAGAGLVAGSDPRQELAETEAKFSPMLAALRSAAHGRQRRRTGS